MKKIDYTSDAFCTLARRFVKAAQQRRLFIVLYGRTFGSSTCGRRHIKLYEKPEVGNANNSILNFDGLLLLLGYRCTKHGAFSVSTYEDMFKHIVSTLRDAGYDCPDIIVGNIQILG